MRRSTGDVGGHHVRQALPRAGDLRGELLYYYYYYEVSFCIVAADTFLRYHIFTYYTAAVKPIVILAHFVRPYILPTPPFAAAAGSARRFHEGYFSGRLLTTTATTTSMVDKKS